MLLDLGSGEERIKDDAIALDLRPLRNIDIIADVSHLPFLEERFDHLYTSHLIEHFSHKTVKSVLINMIKTLKKGGIVEIRCPDLRARALLFFFFPTWKNIKKIYGGQDHLHNYHKCGFSSGLLKKMLNEIGVINIRRSITGYKGIPFLPRDLHLIGIKSD